MTVIDESLKQWATPRQAEIVDAVNREGSQRQAAVALGVHPSNVDHALAALRRKAAIAGYAPENDMTKPVPSPYVVKGTSTLYDKEGNQALQWVKTSLDKERFEEVLKEYISWLTQDARGVAKVTPQPKFSDTDTLAVYGIGDPHLGMHSWGKETGADFDLAEAERLNCAAFDRLLTSAPASETALICEVGDLLHADNNSNRTPASGNTLDVDSRHSKVMMVAVRMIRHMIGKALTKHQKVIFWGISGNHDPHSSFAVNLVLAAFYENEPRVEINLSPSPYKMLVFGKVFIGSVHGDGAKMADLPGVFSRDFRKEWGETIYSYIYTGHIHHDSRKEFGGCIVESLRTMAPADAWHHRAGYRAGRDMRVVVHHRNFGEIERHTANVAMVNQ